MAYTLTDRASCASDLTAKNRVWGFFANPNKPRPANRRQPSQPRREIRPTATKPTSGIPYWPSRDPIGERGGMNLYQMVFNDPVNWADMLGLELICEDEESKKAIEEIRKKSEKGRKNIEQLEKSKHKHKVNSTTGGGQNKTDGKVANESNKVGTGTTSTFNPKGQVGFSGNSVLAHELQHAADKDRGVMEPRDPVTNKRADANKNGYEDSEDRAVDAGNDYRDGAGENRRDDYGDANPDPEKRTPPKPGDPCKCKK